MADLPNEDVLRQLEEQLDSISDTATNAPPKDVASGLTNALALAYRYATELGEYTGDAAALPSSANAPSHSPPSTTKFSGLLLRAQRLADDFDSRLDHQVAIHNALILTGLAHSPHNSSDALSRKLSEVLEACARVFRKFSWLPFSPLLPSTLRACPLLKTLVSAEEIRREAKFFPKTAFQSWKEASLCAEEQGRRDISQVEDLVGLLAWERQARRRSAAFEALEKWARKPTAKPPAKQKRNGHSDEQLRLIDRIKAGLSMRSSTAWSIETLWSWFTPESTLATVVQYAALAVPTFTLAYFGQEWGDIARTHSQRILVATVLVLLTIVGFVVHWLQRARKDATTPGLLSVAATALILVAGAVSSVYMVKRTEPAFACEGNRSDSDCYANYRVVPSKGEYTALYRIGDESSDDPSYHVVRSADVVLSRDGRVVVAKRPPDKGAGGMPGGGRGDTPPSAASVYNITLPAEMRQASTPDLSPVLENLAAIAREMAAQSNREDGPARLPPELSAQLAQLVLEVQQVDSTVGNALENKQSWLDPGLVRFCYEELKRERRLMDRWAESWSGRSGNVAALLTCVNNFKIVEAGASEGVAGSAHLSVEHPSPLAGQ